MEALTRCNPTIEAQPNEAKPTEEPTNEAMLKYLSERSRKLVASVLLRFRK